MLLSQNETQTEYTGTVDGIVAGGMGRKPGLLGEDGAVKARAGGGPTCTLQQPGAWGTPPLIRSPYGRDSGALGPIQVCLGHMALP